MSTRRGKSPFSSRHPRMIFTSSGPAGDHERSFPVAGAWSPRCYACSFCGREFNSAQALGGHMNIHRRDRARLRTSTSDLPSLPHHSDLPPAPQNMPKSPAHYTSTLHLPFEAAYRDNPTSICSSLNTYSDPTIISAAPTFQLLSMRSAADPALLALAAPPSHDENSATSFSAPISDPVWSKINPISDLVSLRFGSCTRSSSAHSLSPNIAPHASSVLSIRPRLENSSVKPAEGLNTCGGQSSTRQFRLDCSGVKAAACGYTAPQRIQFSQAKGRNKRGRGNELHAVKISREDKSTGQRCDGRTSNSVSFTENSNSQRGAAAAAAPSSCVRPSTAHDEWHNDIKELMCLDLELRLGQSSPAAP